MWFKAKTNLSENLIKANLKKHKHFDYSPACLPIKHDCSMYYLPMLLEMKTIKMKAKRKSCLRVQLTSSKNDTKPWISLIVACRRSTCNKCSPSLERWRVNQKHTWVHWWVTQDSSTWFGIWTSQENTICERKKKSHPLTLKCLGALKASNMQDLWIKHLVQNFITLSSATHTCLD